ncbi:MAG: GatB/YqeY domain-containing protein [Candidatus Binatus sp.]
MLRDRANKPYTVKVKDKIQSDLKAAMKSGDKLRTMALRGVLSEISRLEKDIRRDPNDVEILQIIKRERAKREESLEFARKAARQDLIDQNETEAKILESYLPAAASAEEVRAEIDTAIAAGASQMGPVMKALRDKFGAGLDGKMASELAKEALAKK